MKNVKEDEKLLVSSDPNVLILQAMQKMEERARQAEERMQQQIAEDRIATQERMAASEQLMAEVAEKLGGNSVPRGGGGGADKSRAKGRHHEKLERDIDYASFLRWEKFRIETVCET